MGFFDWMFAAGGQCDDPQLLSAVDRVLQGVDPRLKFVDGARERLRPAVQQALSFAREAVGALPPSLVLAPDNWGRVPLLRTMFARPTDIEMMISRSQDLKEFLASADSEGVETLFGVVAATRTERTVLGVSMEGEMLRQDVVQKTLGFSDFRLAGFAVSEAVTRRRLEDFVLEQLALAALREIANDRRRSEQLELHRQLMLTRLRLVEQSGANLGGLYQHGDGKAPDVGRLRSELALNAEELAACLADASLEGSFERVINALSNAETIIRPKHVSFCVDAMNIIANDSGARADAQPIDLCEFSTANPDRPRRVAVLVRFPRSAIVDHRVDLDALLRSI